MTEPEHHLEPQEPSKPRANRHGQGTLRRIVTSFIHLSIFLFIYPALGLLQLWITSFQSYLDDKPVDLKILTANGVLLFFATALFSSALDSLLAKQSLLGDRVLLLVALFVGFGTFFIVISIYPKIPLTPTLNQATPFPQPLSQDLLDKVWSWSLALVVANLLFAFLIRQIPIPNQQPSLNRLGERR